MSVLAEAMAAQAGLVKDPTGNLVYPDQLAPAADPRGIELNDALPGPPAPARPVTPVKATSPEVDIPEPPVVGQASPTDVAPTKKKTLLGA